MIFENIDGVSIPFDKDWNRIAISLSGGADSALLTYLLCKIASKYNPKLKIHVISHIRMWKTRPWQEFDSLRVYSYLQNKFSFLFWQRHTNFIAPDIEYGMQGPITVDEYGKKVSGDNAQIRAYSEYICYHNKIDAYYNGVTKTPNSPNFIVMDERNIEKTDENKHLEFMTHMGKVVSHPFRFVTKSWIVKQYHNLKLTELFDLTRSCEGEFKNINYKNYSPYQFVPICGECSWCKEREWAIEQNK